MSIHRVFLGWDGPCLGKVASYLIERYREARSVDMRNALLVLPGRRAQRRLMEILLYLCEKEGQPLVPPRTTTIGLLPENLMKVGRPVPTELERVLYWAEAVRSIAPQKLEVLVPHPPRLDEIPGWISLGRRIDALWSELATVEMSFDDVASRLPAFVPEGEGLRWLALAEVAAGYLQKLASRGLADAQELRRSALRQGTLSFTGDLILIGAIDCTPLVREFLTRVDSPVTALIHAPEECASLFDDIGGVRVDAWNDLANHYPDPFAKDGIGEARIRIARTSYEEGELVARFIRDNASEYGAEQVTVGICDHDREPHVVAACTEYGLRIRSASGTPLACTPPLTLLDAIGRYLESRRYSDFGRLIRHPDLRAWLLAHPEVEPGYLSEADTFHEEKLPASVPPQGVVSGSLGRVIELVDNLISGLLGPRTALSAQLEAIASVLESVYQSPGVEGARREVAESLEIVSEVLSQLVRFSGAEVRVSGGDALHLVAHSCAGAALDPEAGRETIEFLGWLELALDDAPVLAISGFNEGSVPESINGDPFLPNALRTHLGLLDNDRRYARDAFSLASMIRSKKELVLVLSQRSQEGDGLSPSRLLFHCGPAEIPARISFLYGERARLAVGRHGDVLNTQPNLFLPPKPETHRDIQVVSVSAVNTYLKCPYRFYLKEVCRLESIRDGSRELTPSNFGTFLHDVLKAFGEGECLDSDNPLLIKEFLLTEAERRFSALFGPNVLPVVRVQFEHAKERLSRFAFWQGERRAEGWRICGVERSFGGDTARIPLREGSMGVRARVDRIDQHEASKDFQVLDYKTGDSQLPAHRAHYVGGEWRNLQLPIYRLLARQAGFAGEIVPGFLLLTGKDTETLDIPKWGEAEYESAESCLKEVAQKIRDNVFWPPSDGVRGWDEFRSMIGNRLPQEATDEGV